jgi:hypothetical protein
MFRILFMALAIVSAAAANASAQSFFESQSRFTDSGLSPTFDAQFVVPGKKVDFMAWALVTGGDDAQWGELLFGLSKNIRPWLWVGVAAGVETDKQPFRINPNIWVGKGRFSTFLAYEDGGSGPWYKSVTTVKVSNLVGVGVHSQKYYGTGPYAEVNLPGKFKVWGSVVVFGDPQSTIGLVKSF